VPNVIKLSIQALILEETLLKKGFFQAIFPKLLKVLGNREPLWRGFKGKTLFQKGSPLKFSKLIGEQAGEHDDKNMGTGVTGHRPNEQRFLSFPKELFSWFL
jgi:hypothetical protein